MPPADTYHSNGNTVSSGGVANVGACPERSRRNFENHLIQKDDVTIKYDGDGNRALTDTTGAVTDTYDYDAFGNLIHSTGTTPNVYLYSGEQFDPDLHLCCPLPQCKHRPLLVDGHA